MLTSDHSSRTRRWYESTWFPIPASMVHFISLALVVFSQPRPASAAPGITLHRRAAPNATRLIPLYVVIGVVVLILLLVTNRKRISKCFSPRLAGRIQGVAVTMARNVTAEQLAGTDARNTESNTRSARRTNRRTPSQVSTRSLPVYNKEPGDEELVVYRGPEDMEDATTGPATLMMPAVAESENEGGATAVDIAMSAYYVPLPSRSPNVSLSQSDTSQVNPFDASLDSSTQRLIPPPPNIPDTRGSLETVESSSDNGAPVPQGDAPPYSESAATAQTIRQSRTSAITPSSSTITSASTPGIPDQSTLNRRSSGLRSFFSSFTPITTTRTSDAADPGHTRNGTSSGSQQASGSPVISSPSRHHPSQSGSGAGLTPSMFRTLSRSRTRSNNTLNSTNNLTSPSLISLNSISSPLTHTVVRTEFTYPKSGPTPDQIKLISSRESLGRFGMPYGADAIAHAAAASRLELEPPPPEFEFDSPTAGPSLSVEVGGPDSSPISPTVEEVPEETQEQSVSHEVHGSRDAEERPLAGVSSTSPTSPASDTPPPSASKQSFTSSARSQSRASSVLTFETAPESVHSTAYSEAEDGSESRAVTPRHSTVHLPDATDTTFRPTSV